ATARDVVLAPARQRPSLLAVDIRGLFASHHAPEAVDGRWWRCGTALAGVVDDALEVSQDGATRRLDGDEQVTVSLDAWRALCVAAWAAADGGAPLAPTAVPRLSVT